MILRVVILFEGSWWFDDDLSIFRWIIVLNVKLLLVYIYIFDNQIYTNHISTCSKNRRVDSTWFLFIELPSPNTGSLSKKSLIINHDTVNPLAMNPLFGAWFIMKISTAQWTSKGVGSCQQNFHVRPKRGVWNYMKLPNMELRTIKTWWYLWHYSIQRMLFSTNYPPLCQ
jgi:hypothetical protein